MQFQKPSARGNSRIPSILVGFVCGFIARHMIESLSSYPIQDTAAGCAGMIHKDIVSSTRSFSSTAGCPSLPNGIYPLMRDWNCGHENMKTPRVLRQRKSLGKTGRGRYVVDVGLDEGKETLDAVETGFVVFGFELMPGSITTIRENAANRGLLDRIHFVEFAYDWSSWRKGSSRLPQPKNLPLPPNDGHGFAYIFNAGLSDEAGAMTVDAQQHDSYAMASVNENTFSKSWSRGKVPILRLDQALPSWVDKIFFLKIDTQGHELKVLNGAISYLQSKSVQYTQYEFSPKLMRTAQSGDPLQLLKYMVALGGVCFDMLDPDSHHVITRPSAPLDRYFESINSGKNSTHSQAWNNYANDEIGPWDDILCWFPEATS